MKAVACEHPADRIPSAGWRAIMVQTVAICEQAFELEELRHGLNHVREAIDRLAFEKARRR